jgi:hypothetical protein
MKKSFLKYKKKTDTDYSVKCLQKTFKHMIG